MEGADLTTPRGPFSQNSTSLPLPLLSLPTRQPQCSFSFLKAEMWPLARSTTWM